MCTLLSELFHDLLEWWEMASRVLKGDAVVFCYKHANYLLDTLWHGTSHAIIPRYPLLHMPPSNKAVSLPCHGLVPTPKPQESLQAGAHDGCKGEPKWTPENGKHEGTDMGACTCPPTAGTEVFTTGSVSAIPQGC